MHTFIPVYEYSEGGGGGYYEDRICRQMIICYNKHTQYIEMYDYITVKSFKNE